MFWLCAEPRNILLVFVISSFLCVWKIFQQSICRYLEVRYFTHAYEIWVLFWVNFSIYVSILNIENFKKPSAAKNHDGQKEKKKAAGIAKK